MWLSSVIICIFALPSSLPFTMRERMTLIDDIIEYEIDHPVQRNFTDIAKHIKLYNSLLRDVRNKFEKESLNELKANVLEIWNNGRPSCIYFKDFPILKTKFGWKDDQVSTVHNLLNETEILWNEFDEQCKKNRLDSPESIEEQGA
uniref:Uncharacterized protein n=1 Tax=Clastoptera arizonana TaxID=38151 RepID=A0A1B6CS91_9HEMI